MSQPRLDNTFRQTHTRSHDLSTPQLRALRKELLLVRASVERAEMAEALLDVRSAVTNFSWLRFIVPGFAGARGGGLASLGGLGGMGALLKEYPILSSLASLVLAKPLRSGLASAVRPAIKWGGLAFTAWEGYRVWQQMRRQRDPAAARRTPADEGDLTG
ncbi:DUF3318 domain-containing protein [Paraburkholderia acidisoli]|uniref:DUF3318 domain-containing protein n=1 Tax=Paraburkholderia acidisoli TaxID=2571748 RepID=A0A7Z2JEX8_9BURK|nr:DUF3318 domain-containing protein [Paraburkholderia acidisoli]QGZ62196.1 DUF3318 domain-containing protein [Paraburkholderia acidisoli]